MATLTELQAELAELKAARSKVLAGQSYRDVAVASIASDTELPLAFEYPGTCGSGKAGCRLWGLYFGPINGATANPFDMAVKSLDAEWAVLEVDKSGNFRISECQATSAADVTLDADDFLFHGVTLTHHVQDQIRNLISFGLVEDYQLKWLYQVVNEASVIDETSASILTQLRSASQVGAWQLKQPLYSSQLGSGPPYTFDIRHVAEWIQQKRKLSPLIGYKCVESIAKYGLKREYRRITIDYSATPDAKTWGVYDTAVTSPVTSFYNRCVNNRTGKPEGFTIETILAGMARSPTLGSGARPPVTRMSTRRTPAG